MTSKQEIILAYENKARNFYNKLNNDMSSLLNEIRIYEHIIISSKRDIETMDYICSNLNNENKIKVEINESGRKVLYFLEPDIHINFNSDVGIGYVVNSLDKQYFVVAMDERTIEDYWKDYRESINEYIDAKTQRVRAYYNHLGLLHHFYLKIKDTTDIEKLIELYFDYNIELGNDESNSPNNDFQIRSEMVGYYIKLKSLLVTDR